MTAPKKRGPAKGTPQRGGWKPGNVTAKTAEVMERQAQEATAIVESARARNVKLGKEILEDFSNLFAGMAAYYQPSPNGSPQRNANGDEKKFLEYADRAVEAAKGAAKYQSPTFRAIVIAPPPSAPTGRRVTRFTMTVFSDAQARQPKVVEQVRKATVKI